MVFLINVGKKWHEQGGSDILCWFRFKDTIVNAKYGGHTEAVRRLLGQLPISAQSYSSSPYLDLSLFSYDDKWVSVMERPKTCGDHPIRYAPPNKKKHHLIRYTPPTNKKALPHQVCSTRQKKQQPLTHQVPPSHQVRTTHHQQDPLIG